MADLTFELLDQCQIKRERVAGQLDLTVAEFKLFRAFRGDDALPANKLADRMELSPSRLTRIIDGLEEKRFVRRDIGSHDRRVMVVSLTEPGKKIQRQLEDTYIRTHQDILKLLPSGAADSVLLAMEKLRDAMKRWVEQ